jgi:salicylate hydroxylase
VRRCLPLPVAACFDTALVDVRVDSKVDDIDFDAPSVTLHTGTVVKGDLIVAADGIKSFLRARFLASPDDGPRVTRFCAYRALVPTELMRRDPDLAKLLERSELNVWIGKDVHAMTYCVSRGEMFNLVLSHKDDRPVEEWSRDPNELIREMKGTYEGWDPVCVLPYLCFGRSSLMSHAGWSRRST